MHVSHTVTLCHSLVANVDPGETAARVRVPESGSEQASDDCANQTSKVASSARQSVAQVHTWAENPLYQSIQTNGGLNFRQLGVDPRVCSLGLMLVPTELTEP